MFFFFFLLHALKNLIFSSPTSPSPTSNPKGFSLSSSFLTSPSMEVSMEGFSPTFDPQCSFFEMEEMEMGVNFSITSCKEVDKEADWKKMEIWEPKMSKECDASTRDSHISPSPTIYDYAENFTMEEVFATDDALKEWIKSTSEAHGHVIVAKASEKVVKYSRSSMRFACERSGKYKKFAKKSDGVDRVVKKRVRTTGVKEMSVPL